MGRHKPKPGGPLTAEQARKGRRWVAIAVLSAILHAWAVVGVVALTAPGLLGLVLGLTVLYSIGMPFLLRHLRRDIDRRTINASDGSENLALLARETGLSSSRGR